MTPSSLSSMYYVRRLFLLHDPYCYDDRLTVAIQEDDCSTVKKLVEAGIDILHRHPNYHNNPLPRAVQSDNAAIVKLLLEHNADANIICNNCGDFPLLNAFLKNNTKIVDLLLKHGAKTGIGEIYGNRLPKDIIKLIATFAIE